MSRVVVLGAGMVGLATALLLMSEGVEVIVLDRDNGVVPESGETAWQEWSRPGVTQFRQPHYLLPAGFRLLENRLPDLAADIRANSAAYDSLSLLPESIADRAPRDGDERFGTVAARRPVLEHAVAGHARSRVDIRRGVIVTGLISGSTVLPKVPHITGVHTASGAIIPADLVVDATGRRSALPNWLAELDARIPDDEVEDVRFSYYTRFFRGNGEFPRIPGGRMVTHFDCYSLLTLPGDAGVWSVTVYVSAGDRPMKELRHAGKWTDVVRSCPRHAHLLDGETLSGIQPMSGTADRWRPFVVDDVPVATGVVAVGDSVATTNPANGRGITLGLLQAAGLADVVRECLDQPAVLARRYDRMLRERVWPWYQDTVAIDRARQRQLDQVLQGAPPPAPAGPPSPRQALAIAMAVDPDAFRGFSEMVAMLSLPDEIFARPGFTEDLLRIAAQHRPDPAPGPNRAEILEILA